LIWL